MLASLTPGSAATIAILAACFVLVLIFEFSNGFHDTANAVATVIYTNSLYNRINVSDEIIQSRPRFARNQTRKSDNTDYTS